MMSPLLNIYLKTFIFIIYNKQAVVLGIFDKTTSGFLDRKTTFAFDKHRRCLQRVYQLIYNCVLCEGAIIPQAQIYHLNYPLNKNPRVTNSDDIAAGIVKGRQYQNSGRKLQNITMY